MSVATSGSVRSVAEQVPTCVLLCNAEAEGLTPSNAPAEFRPLSGRGWDQASQLAAALGAMPFRWLLSSPSLDCRQTLVPLAQAQSLDIEPLAELGLGRKRDNLMRLLLSPEADGICVCSHGEVIDELMQHIAPSTTKRLRRIATAEAGGWLVRGMDRPDPSIRYLAPRRIGATSSFRSGDGPFAVSKQASSDGGDRRLLTPVGGV